MSTYRASAHVICTYTAYPYHADDGGPWLPTDGGGLICGKCHVIITGPDFRVLRQARTAMQEAGGEPLVLGRRPPPERLTVADLTDHERAALVMVHGGRLNHLTPKRLDQLVALGLIRLDRREVGSLARVASEVCLRLARECDEASRRAKSETALMFDLGPPDPAAVRRLEARGGRSARR